MKFNSKYLSEIGWIQILGTEDAVESLLFSNSKPAVSAELPPIYRDLEKQLEEYFSGLRKIFGIPLSFGGSEFQKKVWNELLTVPYGRTLSYKELAQRLGDPNAIRAVAAAVGRNPMMILIPCHRIIGSDGSLTGYAGGLQRKKFLLELEQGIHTQTLF